MSFPDVASDLIARAYEGVFDDRAFGVLLEEMTVLNPGGFAVFGFADPADRSGALGASFNVDPDCLADWENEYCKCDPGWQGYARLMRGERFALSHVMPPDALVKTRFYNELLVRMNDCRDYHIAGLGNGWGTFGYLSVGVAHGSAERVYDDVVRLQGVLHPHLKRVFALRRAQLRRDAERMSEVIGGLTEPAVLFAEDGGLLTMNAAAARRVVMEGTRLLPGQVQLDDLTAFALSLKRGAESATSAPIAAAGGGYVQVHGARIGPRALRFSVLETRFMGPVVPTILVTMDGGNGSELVS